MTPETTNKRRAQAKAAVADFRAGTRPSKALTNNGLLSAYSEALRECASGGGPLTVLVLSGELTQWPDRTPTSCASFIRWFYNLEPINGSNDPDNEALRPVLAAALADFRADGVENPCLHFAQAVGCSQTTIRRFAKGEVPRLRPALRRKIWLLLDRRATPGKRKAV